MILVQAATAQDVPVANEQVAEILRARHRTPVGADDFTIFTQQSFLDIAKTITGVLTIFLGGIAGISLLVGGIGIMNIMLVSVTERTREIGLRKAVGARKRDILIQFLTESALLSLAGGLIGIAFGWGLSFLVGVIAAGVERRSSPPSAWTPSCWRRCSRPRSDCSSGCIPPSAPPTWSRSKRCATSSDSATAIVDPRAQGHGVAVPLRLFARRCAGHPVHGSTRTLTEPQPHASACALPRVTIATAFALTRRDLPCRPYG